MGKRHTSLTSGRLAQIFQQLKAEHGLPQVTRCDNEPEFFGEAFIAWAKWTGMAIQYIQPGKPYKNPYVERFNRTYREEALDQHLLASLEDVCKAT